MSNEEDSNPIVGRRNQVLSPSALTAAGLLDPGSRFRTCYSWTLVTLFLCLVPWVAMEHDKAILYDIFWCTTGVSRLLHGATMVGGFYDPNPPLSILVYVPLYFFSHLTGSSYATAAMLTTLLYLALSAAAVFSLATRILARDEAFILSVGTILAGTVFATAEFGERDQFLVFGLLPFILGQIILTYRIPCSRFLLVTVFTVGAVLILLKPHFGLLPLAFLLHRCSLQKRWSIILDLDFVALSGAVISYAAIVWLFFQDYATGILPDALRFYLPDDAIHVIIVYAVLLGVLYLAAYCLFLLTIRPEGNRRLVMNTLFGCALLSLVPYVMEMKDFKYHLTPSLTFAWTATSLFLFIAAQRVFSRNAAAAAVIVFVATAGYLSEPPSFYASQEQMASLPLTRLVRDCGHDCRFVIFSTGLRATMMSGYYGGKDNALRFGSLWFLPELIRQKSRLNEGKPATLTEAAYQGFFHKYAYCLAEDLETARPALAVSCPDDFDYISYFSRDPDFARAWRPYEPAGKVPVNYGVYYPDVPQSEFQTFSCDVYRRRDGAGS